MKRLKLLLFSVVMAVSLSTVWAEAPVEEASSDYQTGKVTESETVEAAPAEDDRNVVESTANAITEEQQQSVSYQEESHSPRLAQVAPQFDTSSMPMDQRVKRVEQQVNNIANMNLPQQTAELQQQIARLRGQLDVQEHDMQLLRKQLADFYKDLESRIGRTNTVAAKGVSDSRFDVEPTKTADIPLQDASAYQAAFALLTTRKYSQAQQAFINYIRNYANGKYVADAHYWLGEIHLLNKEAPNAEVEFQTVINKYAQSPKASDAKLKIAIIHANAGKIQQAKLELLDIKKKNPNSTAAQLANIRLQQLEQGNSLTQ